MCVGIPMQVERCEDGMAECAGRGRRERLNTMLLGDVPCGSWVLAYQGSAVRDADRGRGAADERRARRPRGGARAAPATSTLSSPISSAASRPCHLT